MKKKLDLAILCGGKGKRLKEITKNNSKPLLKLKNNKFLDILINFYKKYDLNKIYLLVGHKSYLYKNYHNKLVNLIRIECIIENQPLGTGGALYQLKNKIKNDFILINGDSYLDYDFIKFVSKFNQSKNICKIALIKNANYKSNKKLTSLDLNKNKKLIFNEKSKYMNAGVYLFKKDIFKYIKKKKFISLENEIIPKLIKKKLVFGEKNESFFIDIGTKKNLILARKNLLRNTMKKSIILDRDGVINYDYGYVYKYSNFKFKKGVIEFLKKLNTNKFKIIIITNQSGIGRGYYLKSDFFNLHKKIKSYLSKKNIFIDDVYFCPHHPRHAKDKYKKKCFCRKPKPGMILKAIKENNLDRRDLFMIGDKRSDFLAAKNSSIKFFYAEENILKQFKNIFN